MKDRKLDILEASCRVVARCGVRGLRVEEVAREAGVSVALIYYYFQNREDLLRRVLEHANARASAYTQAAASGRGARAQIAEIVLREIQDDPVVVENVAVWSEIGASAMFEPTLREPLRVSVGLWVASIEQLIAGAQAEGAVAASVDAAAAAARLAALIDGLSTRWLTGSLSTEAARGLLAGALALELGGETAPADRGCAPGAGG